MLPAPNLDDRQFQDLVDDAKRLVQQRCPTWTDHNVSDPGVTLIEAFAQMVDQLIYRLNRVPDLHYVKFLELIGVELRPPAAARGTVTFWLSAPAAAAGRWSAPRARWRPRAPTSATRWCSAPPGSCRSCPCSFAHAGDPGGRRGARWTPPTRSWAAAGSLLLAPRRGVGDALLIGLSDAVPSLRGAAADGLHGVRSRRRPAPAAGGLGGAGPDGGWAACEVDSRRDRRAEQARRRRAARARGPTRPRSSPGSGPAGCAAGW